jgi:formate/nitrite transporter FocA (FNT family)
MGFSFIVEGIFRTYLPDQHWRPLISKLGYPVGFLLVIAGRQQLFTENTLTAIIPLLARRNWATLVAVLRLWVVVLAANLAGAHIFAWVMVHTAALPGQFYDAFDAIARESANVSPGDAVLRGVFAGWLIAMVVWMIAAVETGRLWIIIILTYVVAIGGFTHVIAGSVEVLYLVMSGEKSWGGFMSRYMAPTLLGNILGGVALVSALNHAQVISGMTHSDRQGQNR